MTIQHLYPTTRPSLDLNFARQKRLDPRVTFTRGSTATYVGSDGLIKTAASNEARFDHDPATGESLGLLVEESRTNQVLNSDTLSDFTNGSCSNQSNAGTSPDGTLGATKIVESSSNEHQYITNSVNYPIQNVASTFTVFLKAGERTNASITIGAGNAIASINVDLTDGSYNTFTNPGWWSNLTFDVTPFPHSWYKVRITGTNSYSVNQINFYPCINGTALNNSAGTNVYQGDGTSGIYVWGAQLESGSFPTSYIPTSGSTVTRSADVASMTGTNFSSWYNQSEGSFHVKAKSLSPTYQQRIFRCRPSSGAEEVAVLFGGNFASSSLYVDAGNSSGATRYTSIGGLPPHTTDFAAGYKQLDFAIAGGGSITTNTTGGVASSPVFTNAEIGRAGSSQRLNGHIARLTYYPTRLTDSQLQELTR